MQKLRTQFKKFYASNTLRFYRIRLQFDQWRLVNELKLVAFFLLGGMLSSVFTMPLLQREVEEYFSNNDSVATLRTLLGGTGSALIGATAIAFSLVVFAMQINIERMPHGLFRQLSSDKRLLGSFLGSFLIALVVAAMSLIPNGSWAIHAILTATCSGQLKLATTLEFFQYRFSDSFGGNPPLYSCGLSEL